MKPYTGGTVMPQSAETLVYNKHDRICRETGEENRSFDDVLKECKRWSVELNSLNSPQIDRRPKK